MPFNLLPKFVQGPRPAHPVTQATGFVRGQDGVTVPSYAESPVVPAVEVPMNRNPVIGMTVAMARKMGFAGRPRIVPEDYGASETTGAPVTKDLPDIKYSLESPPKINMSAPLTPELMEADRRLSPQQVAQRSSIQQNLTRASATASEEFDPAKVRPATRMMAPSVPTQIATVVVPAAPVHSKILPKEPIQRILPKTAVEPVQPEALEGMPEPMLDAIPEALEQPELASAPETPDQPELAEQIEHLEQPGVVANEADTGPDDSGKRFRCVMDGKRFKYRSQLKSYVERKYPSMVDELLKSYPAEG